jgi:hypothetical protein
VIEVSRVNEVEFVCGWSSKKVNNTRVRVDLFNRRELVAKQEVKRRRSSGGPVIRTISAVEDEQRYESPRNLHIPSPPPRSAALFLRDALHLSHKVYIRSFSVGLFSYHHSSPPPFVLGPHLVHARGRWSAKRGQSPGVRTAGSILRRHERRRWDEREG